MKASRDLYEFIQWKGDCYFLGMIPEPNPISGRYTVGPWSLYGPAVSKLRQNSDLRYYLLMGNPKLDDRYKMLFAMNTPGADTDALRTLFLGRRKGRV